MAIKRVILAGLLGSALLLPVTSVTVAAAQTQGISGPSQSISYSGTWQGRTGQDKFFKFRVNASNRVVLLVAGYKVSSGGCTITGKSTLKSISAPINSQQKFKVDTTSANTTIVARGTMVSASRARGSLKVSISDPTGYGCAGSVLTTWRAHPV